MLHYSTETAESLCKHRAVCQRWVELFWEMQTSKI